MAVLFLSYINKNLTYLGCLHKNPHWHVCVVSWGLVQKMITKKRVDIGLFKLKIVRTDIIPIVHYTWAHLFNNIDTTNQVIRDRDWGWDPLNKI